MTERDLTLVRKAQGGDREAFERLLAEHYTMIYRVAYRFTGHAEDAEDIAQNTCLQLVDKLASFKGDSSFTTWLYRVVMNACTDFHKSRRVRRDRTQTYLQMEESGQADSRDTARKVVWLYRVIAELDDTLRQTALLVLAETLSHAEAAKILGCAESTVSWRMHEIRKILTQRLDSFP